MPIMGRFPPLRKAVKGHSGKDFGLQKRSLSLGPNPRTDDEMRAAWYAYHVTDVGKKLQEYAKDFDGRLQAAANAHAAAYIPPPPPPTQPPPTLPPLTGRAALKAAKETAQMANALAKAARSAVDQTIVKMHEAASNATAEVGEHVANTIVDGVRKWFTPAPPDPNVIRAMFTTTAAPATAAPPAAPPAAAPVGAAPAAAPMGGFTTTPLPFAAPPAAAPAFGFGFPPAGPPLAAFPPAFGPAGAPGGFPGAAPGAAPAR